MGANCEMTGMHDSPHLAHLSENLGIRSEINPSPYDRTVPRRRKRIVRTSRMQFLHSRL